MNPLAADRFESFSPTHFGLLVLFAVGAWAVIVWGRSHRGSVQEERYRRVFAVAVVVFAGAMQIYQLTPGDWDLGTSLPLQLCDWAWVAAAIALWTRHPLACGFTYYVGLTITIQGALTPSLGQNFPDLRFFGFWGMHFLVVWAAFYLTWGLGIRPNWRSYWFTVAVTALWAVTAYVFNVIADTNYGYLNRKPPSASLIDVLGPWPWYVFAEVVIVFVGWMVIMTLPWTLADKRREVEAAA